MNNSQVQAELISCTQELTNIQNLVVTQVITSQFVSYLTKYAVVRACGSIEIAFKAVIADFCCHRGKKQIKHFINKRVRSGSANPSMSNIENFLKDFDPTWRQNFKNLLSQEPNPPLLTTSLQSLVDARNAFAHGGSPTVTMQNVLNYYQNAVRIIELLDAVIQ